MVESIAKTLGAGSGIDLKSLVGELVDAQYAATNSALTKRQETLTAQVSSVATLKSGITGFSTALAGLVSGGTLATQPTSSNAAILSVTALSGARLKGLSASVEVRQLAAAQVASTAALPSASAAIGTGTLTLQLGTASVADGKMTAFTPGTAAAVSIDITAANNSLNGIAQAINAKRAGITATVLTDSAGARLVLKGVTGAAQAFTLTAAESADAPGLAALEIGVGKASTSIGSVASDAIVAVDGVAVRRAANTVTDLIDGVRIDLNGAQPGTSVRIGTSPPTAALSQAVSDVVATFNEYAALLKTAIDPVDGPLRGDVAARALKRQLGTLTLAPLLADAPAGTPRTLADIGVGTARDGTMTLDSARLTRALADYPDAVEAMFAAGAGLPAALGSIATAAASTTAGLGASESRYTRAQGVLTDERARATQRIEALRTRMTQQFASMDAKVAAYQSTGSFLQSQVDAWNADR